MYFIILYQGEIIGTSKLDRLDQHKYNATGVFEAYPTFEQVKPIFEQAPNVSFKHHRKFAGMDKTVVPFYQMRDALDLHVWRSDGQRVASRILGIQWDAFDQIWKIVVHADDFLAFSAITEAYHLNAIDLFSQYARRWTEKPQSDARDDAVVVRAIQIMRRRTKNNPVLIVGPSGQCRNTLSAIVAALRQGEVEAFAGWNIVELDDKIVCLTQPYMQARNLLEAILSYGYQQTPRSLFVVEQFDQLGKWAGNILTPFMAHQHMQIIGTATLADYRQYIEKSASIQRWTQEIMVNR